jgi:cytochrome c oxidase assembly protein subunit 15
MLKNIALTSFFLAFIVVMLGAWVRLTDAGLGCPDWPGCYGDLIVPSDPLQIDGFDQSLNDRPFDEGKAWREMAHRYLASILGLLCLTIFILAWKRGEKILLPTLLISTIVFQGILGMLTVTWLLKPLIVIAHLLGGLTTLSLLFLIVRHNSQKTTYSKKLSKLLVLGLGAVIVQIALGGWTSSNYAAVACPDFPTCQAQWWPDNMNFKDGFDLWHGIGIDYEGGILDNEARTAIHFTHRLSAIFVTVILLIIGFLLRKIPTTLVLGSGLLAVLSVQISIGIALISFGFPITLAVLHNGVGALLLLTIIEAVRRTR